MGQIWVLVDRGMDKMKWSATLRMFDSFFYSNKFMNFPLVRTVTVYDVMLSLVIIHSAHMNDWMGSDCLFVVSLPHPNKLPILNYVECSFPHNVCLNKPTILRHEPELLTTGHCHCKDPYTIEDSLIQSPILQLLFRPSTRFIIATQSSHIIPTNEHDRKLIRW